MPLKKRIVQYVQQGEHMFVVQYAQILEKNRGIFRVFLCKMTKVICLTIWYNCTKISIQLCELCTQLKCYKNVTNCYKIVTPTFQKFFSLIQKIPTAKIYQQLIHTLFTSYQHTYPQQILGKSQTMKGEYYASFRQIKNGIIQSTVFQ